MENKQDGKQLEKLITFEDDESTSRASTAINLPQCPKMVVNEQVGDFIGRFLEQYFKAYDSDNREQLGPAYHENAMMSMQASFAGVDFCPKNQAFSLTNQNASPKDILN